MPGPRNYTVTFKSEGTTAWRQLWSYPSVPSIAADLSHLSMVDLRVPASRQGTPGIRGTAFTDNCVQTPVPHCKFGSASS